MVRQLLTRPSAFMERKTKEPGIRREIGLLLLLGALSLPGLVFIARTVLDATESEEMQFVLAGWALRPMVIVLVLCVTYTVLFHVLSRHYNARGPIRDVFKGEAWAMVPLGIGNLVQTATLYLAFDNVVLDDVLEGMGPPEQVDSLMLALLEEPVMLVSGVVVIATVLWSGYLMTFAVEHAKEIPRENATRVVAVPIAAHVLLAVWALIQGTASFALLL